MTIKEELEAVKRENEYLKSVIQTLSDKFNYSATYLIRNWMESQNRRIRRRAVKLRSLLR